MIFSRRKIIRIVSSSLFLDNSPDKKKFQQNFSSSLFSEIVFTLELHFRRLRKKRTAKHDSEEGA